MWCSRSIDSYKHHIDITYDLASSSLPGEVLHVLSGMEVLLGAPSGAGVLHPLQNSQLLLVMNKMKRMETAVVEYFHRKRISSLI